MRKRLPPEPLSKKPSRPEQVMTCQSARVPRNSIRRRQVSMDLWIFGIRTDMLRSTEKWRSRAELAMKAITAGQSTLETQHQSLIITVYDPRLLIRGQNKAANSGL